MAKRGFPDTMGIDVGQIVIIQTDEGRERGRVSCLRPFGKQNTMLVQVAPKRHYIVPKDKAEIV